MRRSAIVLSLVALAPLGCKDGASQSVAPPPAAPTTPTTPEAVPSGWTPVVATEPAMPKVGDPAPALVATASDGTKVDLSSMKGKYVVVYFYPKDDTPGCTKEACAFRDVWGKLETRNVYVVGVSLDDDKSHTAFKEKYKLPFPLVADTSGDIAKRFGVPVKNGYASRVSFLIGPDGRVKRVYPKVDPGVHAETILSDVAAEKG